MTQREMDSPSADFFTDCLGFDDSSTYQSPEQSAENDAICLDSFNPFDGKEAASEQQTPADDGRLQPRADGWGSFSDLMDAPTTADQGQLFVDPELYSSESQDHGVKAEIQVIPNPLTQARKRRGSSSRLESLRTSKSCSTSTAMTPPEEEPPQKRRARRIKQEAETAEEQAKRDRFLERNRIAASKCREKKKQYTQSLENQKLILERQHIQLLEERGHLKWQTRVLKDFTMLHAKCNDPRIDTWLKNEAEKFVQTAAASHRVNEHQGDDLPPFDQAHLLLVGDFARSRTPSLPSAYSTAPGVQFNGLGSGEHRGSIGYPHGQPGTSVPPSSAQSPLPGLSSGAAPLYPSPTAETFPSLPARLLKSEPDTTNFDFMPDSMFSPDPPNFCQE